MKPYLTVEKEAACELAVKKSRFIGTVCPADSQEAAAEKIAEIKKHCWDAAHNCSAMIIGEDGRFRRFSDDGEPQGTAGMPMLEVLSQNGLANVLAVVTRYFGGVLLGAGGLVRAYSSAAAGAVRAAGIVRMVPCGIYGIAVPYALYGRLENITRAGGYAVENAVFGKEVSTDVLVPEDLRDKFLSETADAFLGKVQPVLKGEKYRMQRI